MIEAQELRIGNWINSGAHFGEIQVSAILKDGVNPFDWGQGNHCIHFYDTIAPIKITEEWLLKLGFRLIKEITHDFTEKIYGISLIKGQPDHEEQLYISLPFGCIHIGALELDEAYALNIDINHVHKIQNLFYSLAGWELTIK